MNEWHGGGVEVRECEIDLVAEHGVASVTGLSSADAVHCPAYPGVSGAPALPGKALIYLFPLSQKRRLTLKVTASVCMCVHLVLITVFRFWPYGSL